MAKIGIYGGTFDPVHHAHLILAREALETLQLAKVLFVPAAVSPHKTAERSSPAEARVEMLRSAIADELDFELSELELQRPAPSYTIETIEELKRARPQDELYYLLGSDNLPQLQTWRRFGELRELVTFVVLARRAVSPVTEFFTIHRPIEISATEIRNRVARGRSIRYLVPPAVADVIARRELYQELPK